MVKVYPVVDFLKAQSAELHSIEKIHYRGILFAMSYQLAKPVPRSVQNALKEYGELTQQLLHTRGIRKADAARAFLNPDYEEHQHDPFLMTDMEKAVLRILKAIAENEHIAIYSDYDCDGIPGGVLLHDFFRAIGYDNFENYIPHRHYEGFGFNIDAVKKLRERKTKLIITVDCGITDVKAVERANKSKIDVIITDHHEPNGELPDAYAILDPKRDDKYPFSELCGSGVAFKLIEALIAKGDFDLKPGWEKWWLDVVGLATVADMVPLVGENRVFAHYGLAVLRKTRRPGLQHLFRITRINQRSITEDDVGFMIGPRINAASRMDNPEDAFNMLATQEEGPAGAHARHLEKLNNERKGVVAAMTKEIKKRIAALSEVRPVIVMGNPEWRPSLVGLAANSLAEEYKRPVFLWGRDGREIIKGSCRSDGKTSVVLLMEAARDALIDFGGHHFSGGFSVSHDEIHTLGERLNEAYERVKVKSIPSEKQVIDANLSLREVNRELIRALTALAPYGVGNPKPLFRFKDVIPSVVEIFGKGKDHTKILFDVDGYKLEAIAFFAQPDNFKNKLEAGREIDLIAHVEQSFFMNREQIRLRVVDIV